MTRRSLLFLTSYAPLAAMFVATEWPRGWSRTQLTLLGLLVIGATAAVVLGTAALFFTRSHRKWTLAAGASIAAVLASVGALRNWWEPAAWHAPHGHTRATIAALALALCAAGLTSAAVIFYSGHQTSNLEITVTDPRDQAGAAAAYLATYLLPLLSVTVHTWNTAIAYAIYLATLYIIFVRSEGLVLINPSLYLLGYRVFDVRLDPPEPIGGVALPDALKRRVLLLARDRVTYRKTFTVVDIGDDCYLSVR